MPTTWKKNFELWFYGALSTFIGGGASSGAAIIIDPVKFNIHDGLKNVMAMFVASGIINLFMYLKKSPLPKLPDDITITTDSNIKVVTTPTSVDVTSTDKTK